MPDNFEFPSDSFEDISSSSLPSTRTIKVDAVKYGNGIFKNISGIIKAIAFIVSIGIFVLCVGAALLLVMLDKFFVMIAIAVIIVGVALSLISLFLIYGMGHIIAQNDEILKHL